MKSIKYYLLITALCSCSFLHAATAVPSLTPSSPSAQATSATNIEQTSQAAAQNQTLTKKSIDHETLLNRMGKALKRFYQSDEYKATTLALLFTSFLACNPPILGRDSVLMLIGINGLLPLVSYALCRS